MRWERSKPGWPEWHFDRLREAERAFPPCHHLSFGAVRTGLDLLVAAMCIQVDKGSKIHGLNTNSEIGIRLNENLDHR
jgi:hypothetical protein